MLVNERLGQTVSAIGIAFVLVFATTGQYAFGDQIRNTIGTTASETTTITAGDSFTSTYYAKDTAGSGCDPATGTPAHIVVSIAAGATGLTASPSSFDISQCDTPSTSTLEGGVVVTFSSTGSTPAASSPGYHITVSVTDAGAADVYNIDNSDFYVIVNAPTPSDTTPPVISYTVNGDYPANPDGDNGWYVSNAVVDWTVTDPESTISSTTGCVDTTINSDTSGTTLSCSATSAGGTAGPASITIKRDATAPTISGSATPAPNGDGWNNADVTVSFTCGDATSGIASCTADTPVGEGSAQSVTGTAIDNAGNSNTDTVSGINVDKTVPGITGEALPAPNGNGWNNVDVTVTFTCTDGLSGIKSCTDPITLSAEAAGQSATGTAVDYADNSASVTISGINIDKSAPTIGGSASPAANLNGWNNAAVTVHFTCADALSGIDSCTADVVLSSEGAGQSASGTAYDLAGNSATTSVTGINIDLTKPLVSLVGGPADSTSYYFGFVPALPTCSASDALSGLDGSCSVSGYSAAVGTHTVTASATDKAGNTNTQSHTYTVNAWTLSGFYQPVDMSPNAPTDIVWNTVKGGQTVPLKFEIFADTEFTSTLFNNTPIGTFKTTKVNCGIDPTPIYDDILGTTGGTSFRYDTTSGQFIQNWQTTKSMAGNCFTATFTAQDGSSLMAYFKIK